MSVTLSKRDVRTQDIETVTIILISPFGSDTRTFDSIPSAILMKLFHIIYDILFECNVRFYIIFSRVINDYDWTQKFAKNKIKCLTMSGSLFYWTGVFKDF